MDNPTPTPSTLETLRTVEFRLGLKGYNVDEVDEYLEKAAVEAEALQEQFRQVNERLRQAGERIAQLEGERRDAPAGEGAPAAVAQAAPADDGALQRTLLLAQKFVDQAKRESEAEASERIAQAEEKARAMMAEAEEKARQLSTDADRKLREEVTRLEAMRGQLVSDVENMARHLEAERTRLRGSLSEVLRWVEEHLQPAGAITALRTDGAADDGDKAAPAAQPAQPAQPQGAQPSPPAPAQPTQAPASQAPASQGRLDVAEGGTPDERPAAPEAQVKVAGNAPAEPS